MVVVEVVGLGREFAAVCVGPGGVTLLEGDGSVDDGLLAIASALALSLSLEAHQLEPGMLQAPPVRQPEAPVVAQANAATMNSLRYQRYERMASMPFA